MQKENTELNAVVSNDSAREWIEERASVVAIDGKFAEVLPVGQSACKSCSSNSGCSTNAFAFFLSGKKSNMRILNALNAKVGDEVLIGIPSGALMMSTTLAYVIPLLFLLLGALFGQIVFSYNNGWNTEVGSMIFAGLGLLAGFVISSWFAKIVSLLERYQPVILSIGGHSIKPVSFRSL
ncbi:MAG: Unknown protein [uncultured Thiotrichaceae bacterium]|uniref:Sigma factor RpoE regulatory protein RseC n=1 Tax=uncultured Thiotrichaceae bacterium TaxID=298394 RepID=A0A6S6TBK1_9GAMM|nr:MAG: Unknown protein [uncultured Thiotrichaceae bacterium]